MKKLTYTLFALLVICAVPSALFAETINPPLSPERQEIIKTNIIAGLQHSSQEVQADYVQLMIDLKRAYPQYNFNYAIIPLMDKLKNEDNCGMRILAALALYEFQDSRMGRFAVEQTIDHCKSQRLAKFCQTLIRKWDKRTERAVYTAQVVYPF
ncbi:MAG: hypothetical protein IH600_06230 [Bacteroidetes bacterium]|nr:hypothetical protein [Bacteroidota bacterium]